MGAGAYRRADAILDHGQRRVFRLLWFFLPETSVAKEPRFQQVLASRFLSDAGQQSLAYGALIAVVRGGGSTFEAALVGVAAVLPPALLGLYGGAVADALPKRVALAAIYNLQALLCILTPTFFGTDLMAALALVFAVNALGQVSGPTELSVLPLVASERQLASAASLVSLASNAGTAFGTALLAPVLVRAFGLDAVFYVAGALLFLAASRVFDLTTHHDDDERPRFDWRRRADVNAMSTVRWLLQERAVATMVLVAVLAGTANVVLQTLGPRYVQTVIGVDPAEAVYVFAPSVVGLLIALAAGPVLVRRFRERIVALAGFAIVALTLFLLGTVDDGFARALDPVNPLRIIGLDISPRLRAAGLLAVPLGFGLALTTNAVQTYINRRVPIAYQGRAFALQSTLKNGSSIVPLLVLGGLAAVFGVKAVLLASPFLLLALAAGLVRLSYAFGGTAPATRLEVLSSFWEEPEPNPVAPFPEGKGDAPGTTPASA